jgi:ubiquinone/menaquinone biosynthesis C-methylase UbiE
MENAQTYKEKSASTFNKQAANYDSTYCGRHAQMLYSHVMDTMGRYEFQNVLDVGCGTGNVLAGVLKKWNVSAAGIDLSDNMLDIAKKRIGEKADLRKGDSENLPWESNMFDMVICTDSFHHYPNPEAVLSEMKRVVKPEGKIIIADPWLSAPFRQIANLFMPLCKDGDVKIYSCNDLRKLLQGSRLNLKSWEKSGKNAFIAVIGICPSGIVGV